MVGKNEDDVAPVITARDVDERLKAERESWRVSAVHIRKGYVAAVKLGEKVRRAEPYFDLASLRPNLRSNELSHVAIGHCQGIVSSSVEPG